MIVEHGQQDLVGNDVISFVNEKNPVFLGNKSEKIHGGVEMGQCHDFPPDVVVQFGGPVGVEKAVAHPLTCV